MIYYPYESSPCTGTDSLLIPHRNSNFAPHPPLSLPFSVPLALYSSTAVRSTPRFSHTLRADSGSQQLVIWVTGVRGVPRNSAAVLPRLAGVWRCDSIQHLPCCRDCERARELGEGAKGKACAEPSFASRIRLVLTQTSLDN